MSRAILCHFLCARHVSEINISIIRSLWLWYWITTSVVMFSVRCVLEIWCGWVAGWSSASACNTDTTQIQPHQISNTQRTENKTTDVVIQQHIRKLLMMDILMSETCWAHKKWNKIASDINQVGFLLSSLLHRAFRRITLIINQQCTYIKFHIKTLKIAPTCCDPKIILRELRCSLLKSF